MARLIILGSSNAIPSINHENTHMVLTDPSGLILIDCPGNLLIRLQQARLDPLDVNHLVLTHFHPDHISGAPSFIMQSWLLGRKKPIHIYGLAFTLDKLNQMMELYEWQTWPDLYPVHFHKVPEFELSPLLETQDVQIFASPVKHIVPTLGLRFEFKENQTILAYSCDTEPCPSLLGLSSHADILIHEASGCITGHSSAAQAGKLASKTGVNQLVLIHYPTHNEDLLRSLIYEAKTTYTGNIILAKDFMEFNL